MQFLQRLFLAIALLIFSNCLFAQNLKRKFTQADSNFVFNRQLNPVVKRRMRDSAFANQSTSPNFVVIVATDRNTGISKEVCTEAPFVEGGLSRNKGKQKTQNTQAQNLLFNTKVALNNIGFNEYTYDELFEYGKNAAVKKMVSQALQKKTMEVNFQGSRKQQFMFAHILFNNGVMSTSGCDAGNFMVLTRVR